MPDDELPHIFDELYRGQEARGFEGSGLGLALVKAVVERHGGAVTTRCRPGRGSVFNLRLPAGPAANLVQSAYNPACEGKSQR